VLVHRHIHSTDLLSHCITQESHLEFLVNSVAQRRLIHHLHFCSHDDAPNTLGFHMFTLCSATSTSNSVDHLSHKIIIWSSSQLSEWRMSSLGSSSILDRNPKRSTMIKPSQQDSRTSGTKGSLAQGGSQIKRKTFQKYNASTIESMVTTRIIVPS
jgi:hypothetical protein